MPTKCTFADDASGFRAVPSESYCTDGSFNTQIAIVDGFSTRTTSAIERRATWHVIEYTKDSYLSPGGRAGVAIGVCGFVFVVLAWLVVRQFVKRRRRRRQGGSGGEQVPEKQSSRLAAQAAELDAGPRSYEVDGRSRPPEVDARETGRAELEGHWTGWEAPALAEVDLSRPRVEQDPPHGRLLLLSKQSKGVERRVSD